jgi:hypothetical protein
MATGKHKSKRKRDDVLEPEEQLSNKRHEAAELIMKKSGVEDGTNSPVNYDIDHNIREIRAMLKLNEEIFDRCMKFMTANVKNTKKEEKKAAPAKKVAETKIYYGSSSSSSSSSSDSSDSESEDEDKPQGKTVCHTIPEIDQLGLGF